MSRISPMATSILMSAVFCAWHFPIDAATGPRLEPVIVQILPTTNNDEVTLRFLNNSATKVRLPREIVPKDGVAADLFEVSHRGRDAAYAGPLFEPENSEYIELQPGELLETTARLDFLYDIVQPGTHDVRFDALAAIKVFEDAANGEESEWASKAAHLVSDYVQVTMMCGDKNSGGTGGAEGDPVPGDDPVWCKPDANPKIPPFVPWKGCSTEQQEQFQHVVKLSLLQAAASRAYFSNLPANPKRGYYWFGDWTASLQYMSNPIVARTYFGEIAKKLASGDLIASCNQLIETDRASSAALVRPLMANQIYLGESFWNYPTIGNYKGTSQASIIVHEVSHFIDVAGTTDVFGISSYEDAHDFALFMPGNAPFVALSYQYFAENDPFKQ